MGEVAQPPAVPLFVQEVEEGNSSDVLSLNAQLPGERSMRYDLGQVVPCDAGGVVVIVVGVELCWCWGPNRAPHGVPAVLLPYMLPWWLDAAGEGCCG